METFPIEQISFLYTKPACPACVAARELLTKNDELFREVLVDNPATALGISTLLQKNGEYFVPLLIRPRVGIFHLAKLTKNGDFQFVKLKIDHE